MLDGVETTVNVETPSAMTVAEFASKALETATKLDSLVQSRPGVVHVAGMRNDCCGLGSGSHSARCRSERGQD